MDLIEFDECVEFCMFDTALHNCLICLSKNRNTKIEECRLVSRRIIELTSKRDIQLEGFFLKFALFSGYLLKKFVFLIN